MSPVDGLFIILSGAVVVALELASGADVPDGALDADGAVLEVLGGEAGLIDELDDVESVLGAGVEDDFEGEGATTGGVADVVTGVEGD
jgi:hypothetical protein